MIRPAKSTQELIREGEKLSHCVGTYAERYANREVNILVIRKKKNSEEPFYTMEISKNKIIIQCRGKRNCSMTDEIKKFVEQYEKDILDAAGKKKKQNEGEVDSMNTSLKEKSREKLMEVIIEYHGEEKQLSKANEELNELRTAITNYKHTGSVQNLAEEIADVMNMITQVIKMSGINWLDVYAIMDYKLIREKMRIMDELQMKNCGTCEHTAYVDDEYPCCSCKRYDKWEEQ